MQFTCKAVGQSYFKNVIAGMVKAGYALVSNVEINSHQMPYHVDANFARSTNLFFHIIGKSVLVHLEYHENDTDDVWRREYEKVEGLNKIIGYWKVTFWVQYKPYEIILKMVPPGLSFDEQDEWIEKIPFGRNSDVVPYGDFVYRGGVGWSSDTPHLHGMNFHETLFSTSLSGPCDPGKLVQIVTEMIKPTLPFADKRPIYKLQVTSIAPAYTFSGKNNRCNDRQRNQLEQLFWSRMDLQYFPRLVHKPWGSSYFDSRRQARHTG